MGKNDKILEFSAEIEAAIKKNRPIVALESTIISHGMPYPSNVETAKILEDIVREGDVNIIKRRVALIKVAFLKINKTEKEKKYDEFINYIYPILQNIQRKHGIVKERIIQIIFYKI